MNIFKIKGVNNKLLIFSTLFIIISLPWNNNINSFFIILNLILWAINVFKERKVDIRKSTIVFGIPFFLALVGLFQSENLSYGFKYLLRSSSALIIPLTLSKAKFNNNHLKAFFLMFIASCALRYFYAIFEMVDYNLFTIIELLHNNSFLLKFKEFFAKEILHPTYFSIFLIINIIICIHYFFKTNKHYTLIIILLFFFNLLMLLTISAKMSLISLFIILLIAPYYYANSLNIRTKKNIYVLMLMAFFLVFFLLLRTPNRISQEVYNYYNYFKGKELIKIYDYDKLDSEYQTFWFEKTNRIVIWKNCIELLEDNFVFGLGTGDVQDELIKVYKKNKELWRMQFFNSHNQYLDFILRYGLPGLLLLLFMISFIFKRGNENNSYLYISFILLYSLSFLTENLFERQWGIVSFSLFNSIFYYHIIRTNKSRNCRTA